MNNETHESIKQNPFEVVSQFLQAEFANDSDLQVSFTTYSEGMARLRFEFKKTDGMNAVDTSIERSAMKRAGIILKKNEMEVGGLQGMGNWSMEYRVYQRTVEGKINWRRWLPYPQNFSEANQALLDEVANFPEVQTFVDKCQGDDLSKFTSYVRFARENGLINMEESGQIERQYHNVANA